MFAMHYYSLGWVSVFPSVDRLGKLDVRYDPRDISHVYVRDPETRLFRPVERRDGQLTPVTLWEHDAERAGRRTINQRSNVEKVAFRREIAAITETAKPSKRQLRDAVRMPMPPRLKSLMRSCSRRRLLPQSIPRAGRAGYRWRIGSDGGSFARACPAISRS